ncbi:ATP-binding protein [Streptomyces sp. NPDC059349]
MGLAIVDSLVRAHGGRVEIETAPGEGANFRILLPLHS